MEIIINFPHQNGQKKNKSGTRSWEAREALPAPRALRVLALALHLEIPKVRPPHLALAYSVGA